MGKQGHIQAIVDAVPFAIMPSFPCVQVGSASLSLAEGAASTVANLATGAASASVSLAGSSAGKVAGLASGAVSLVRKGSHELLSSLARVGSSEHLGGTAGALEEGGTAGTAGKA